MKKLYLSELSEKDRPWDKHRFETDVVSALFKQVGYDRLVERLDSCSQRLLFAVSSENRFCLEGARFCRVRECPTCQWRRQLMWKARFIKALPNIERDYPRNRWIFLTLTVRNCSIIELRETLYSMNDGWKRLIKRKAFPAIGFIKSVEVTRNSTDGSAHPHFHVLLMVKPGYFKGKGYVNHDGWVNIWQKCLMLDYKPVVNVKAVKDVNTAAAELLKYSVKPADLIADAEWLARLTIQLHKTRAVSVGGLLKKYLSEEEPSDEELIHGDEPTVEIFETDPRFVADWSKPEKRYKGKFRE